MLKLSRKQVWDTDAEQYPNEYKKGSYGLETASTLRDCLKIPKQDDVRISNGRLLHHLTDEKRKDFFCFSVRT